MPCIEQGWLVSALHVHWLGHHTVAVDEVGQPLQRFYHRWLGEGALLRVRRLGEGGSAVAEDVLYRRLLESV
ncbi:MAG: hypothetical protein M1118_12635 [Chloroflexi bacterium]|nr:hypothetical protein [Chloroflexota bacterium]